MQCIEKCKPERGGGREESSREEEWISNRSSSSNPSVLFFSLGIETHLSRSHTDFWTSIDMNTTMSFSGNGGTDSVYDSQTQRPTFQTITQSQNGVCSFSRLRNENTNVISENRSLTIQKVRSQFDRDWNFCQFFEDGTSLFRVEGNVKEEKRQLKRNFALSI